MPEELTLHDLYIETAYTLELKDNGNYSFYHDKEENRFAEYTGPKRTKRSPSKTSSIGLANLDYEHKKQMLLVAYNQATPFRGESPIVHVQIELLHKKPPERGYKYPRVSRVSEELNRRGFDWEE